MKLANLSFTQRLGAGFGCVVILALACASIIYVSLDVVAGRKIDRELVSAPRGWTDSLRASGTAPAGLAAFRGVRDTPGDGAGIVHDTSLWWISPSIEGPYRAIVSGWGTREDSATWRSVAADTALDRFAAAARHQEWHALDWVLRGTDSTVRTNILALPIPRFAPIRNAARGLIIRAIERLRHGDAAAARADLGAAVSLGQQLFEREPSAAGALSGRSVIASGVHGWIRYAELTHDTALAARARPVLAWASTPPGGMSGLLLDAPDSALALGADRSLSLGMRAQALQDALSGWLLRPRGMLFGPPGRYRRAIDAMRHDPDADLGRLAAMTAATADRLNLFSIAALMREAGR